jgi:hypothetical protein
MVLDANGTRDICIELYIVVLDKQRDVHTNSMVNDVINFINRRGVRDTTLCVKFVSDLLQVGGLNVACFILSYAFNTNSSFSCDRKILRSYYGMFSAIPLLE